MSKVIRQAFIGLLCLSLCSLILLPVQAQAAEARPSENQRNQTRKFALVIGNGQYQGINRALKNPTQDARLMSETLLKLGFEVQTHLNLSRTDMSQRVSAFAAALPAGATSLVFYAGHGLQINGASYLMPVDIQLSSEQNVQLRAYPLRRLLDEVSSAASAINIVILDACRDNPFQPPPPVRYRSQGPMGLARVLAPRGTLLAYSTQPGQLAADGTGANSTYTATLAKTLLDPELSLEDIFRKVNTLVRNASQDDQIPWFETSLTDPYYLLPPEGTTVIAGRSLRTGTPSHAKQAQGRSDAVGDATLPTLWFLGMQAHELGKLQANIDRQLDEADAEAIAKWQQQAEGGNVVAMTLLGRLHLRGAMELQQPELKVAGQKAMALHWFQKAAEQHFPIAQAELAWLYRTGDGVSQDLSRARELLEKASKARYRRAEMDLLEMNIFSASSPM